jgi:hypothetical protein
MCLSFYSERKKYQEESAPIIECGGNGVSYRPMAHHYATNMWGGKDKRANTHTKRTLAKLGKSVRNYGCEADIGRKKDVQPIPKSHRFGAEGSNYLN